MSRKGAFKSDDLDDIDDLLPPPPPPAAVPPTLPTPPAVVETLRAVETPEPAPAPKPARKTAARSAPAAEPAASKRTRQAPARARATQSTPEAHVASVVADALRRLTHAEKQQRGRGRSYGEVVLDAIEQFETELREHFTEQVEAKPKGRLFQRVDSSRPRRRRHAEPPVKIPLAGIISTDVESLDLLADEWHAGSRSALVDQALRLYLAEEIAALASEAEESADEGDLEAEAAV
ncbi:hypothetical protein ABZ319_08590 [Nocardia sp. NPDC005978]|uniref:hypothetical protein n=1 Tax=Nocardia sp. NPDC005978 TaxID=3156725 RepID=UPI0033A5C5B2